MDVSVDTHQCIRCGQTIVGIDAYVEHRKFYCLGSSSPVHEREPLEPSLLPDVPDLQDLFVSFLDLQRKPVETLESASEDDEDPLRPPGNHTGGKWKPGCRPSIMQGMQTLQRDRTPSPERLPLMLEKMGCAPCGRIFRDKYTYQRHLESSLHRKRSLRNAQILRTQQRPVVEAKPPEILFEESPRELLRKTRRKKAPPETPLPTPNLPLGSSNKPRSRCSICYMWFSDKKRLKTHIANHKSIAGEEFHCSDCQERFSDGSSLREHLKTHKEHRICCGKAFSTLKGYREHKEAVHAAVVEWLECEKCSKAFRTQRALRDHRCLSESTASFPCSLCNYVGNSKKNLDLHKRSHSQEKRFKCNLCDYNAARHSQLWRHKKLHDAQKIQKCPYCDYTCALIENLRAHILRGTKHAGLKVYPCSKCSFSTNSSSEAKSHQAVCDAAY